MTRYEVERAPGQPRSPKDLFEGSGWRVVAVTGDKRRPMLTRFHERQHAVDEALRLTERDAALCGIRLVRSGRTFAEVKADRAKRGVK